MTRDLSILKHGEPVDEFQFFTHLTLIHKQLYTAIRCGPGAETQEVLELVVDELKTQIDWYKKNRTAPLINEHVDLLRKNGWL